MKIKKDKENVERTIIFYVWIYAIFVAVVLFLITFKWVLPLSFLLGVATNLLCFSMTIRTIDKIFKYEEEDKKRELIKNNVAKYLIYFVVLALAGVSYYFNKDRVIHLDVIATACGFFSVKLMIYFKYFIYEPLFMKKKKTEPKDIAESTDENETNN
ncbi:MAG: hypothetical protein RBR48_01570 [Bacilli bacterium]|jgi:Ca2+/Na+ antiporter|nr:hypothetical protein [Bacilli bacterium]MDY0208856.1 hypothetical protein [Bacilli bacterium]